jgi:hypothetical protein
MAQVNEESAWKSTHALHLFHLTQQLLLITALHHLHELLHLLELLGGWPGAFLAQRRLRHKSSKGSYLFVFVLIVGLHQFLAIDALRGWPFLKLVSQGLQKL